MMAEAREPLPFNPAVFRWARARLGKTVEEVAAAIKVKVERLAQWESGERVPTVAQARNLADVYDRPFLEFFADEPPAVPEVALVPDFRLHRTAVVASEEVALREVQGWAEELRLNALALLQELGEPVPCLPDDLTFTVADDFEVAAERARSALDFTIQQQLSLKAADRRLLPEIIRSKLERRGVLVLKQSGLAKLLVRGICLYANPMPTIVFGNESPGAQAFTLAHELGHVLLKASAISGQPTSANTSKPVASRIEAWCDEFAASFLVPRAEIDRLQVKPGRPSAAFDLARLAELAQQFSVSRHAMLVRLTKLGHVEPPFYWQVMRSQFDKEEEEYTSFGRAPYYGTRFVNSRGRLYTGLVLEAWDTGRITSHNAAEYMGITNLTHLRDIREHFGR